MLRQLLMFCAIACFCVQGVLAATPPDLDVYVQQQMQMKKIPGVAFAVIDRGKIVMERAYGSENLETGTPLHADGVFEIASVTKPFTATAIMLLVQDGKLRLEDPISRYLDGTPSAWKEITVGQLLSHTSGLTGMAWVECKGSPLLDIATKTFFDEIAKQPLRFAPGESAAYSDAGYFLLGMIIEKVSGMRYADFMQRHIFEPFGMAHTSILDRRLIVRNHVAEYTLHNGELEHDRRVWQHELPSYFGMLSTVDDLANWMIALTQGRVVSSKTLDQMWTPAKLKEGKPAEVDGMPYGLGWFVLDLNGHPVVGHPGFLGSFIVHYVEDDFTVIVLTNLDTTSGSHQVALAQGIVALLRPELRRFIP